MNIDELRQALDELAGSPGRTSESMVADLHRRGARSRRWRRSLATGGVIVIATLVFGAVVVTRGSSRPIRVEAPPSTSPALPFGPRPKVSAVGDSVMLGAKVALSRELDRVIHPSATSIDAAESRQFVDVLGQLTLQRQNGRLGDVVIVHAGNNGTFSPEQLDQTMRFLADIPRVVVLNDKVPRPWEAPNNDRFAAGLAKYPNVVSVDWHAAAQGHPEYFYDDGIHLRPEGADAYARLIVDAVMTTARNVPSATTTRAGTPHGWSRIKVSSKRVTVALPPGWRRALPASTPEATALFTVVSGPSARADLPILPCATEIVPTPAPQTWVTLYEYRTGASTAALIDPVEGSMGLPPVPVVPRPKDFTATNEASDGVHGCGASHGFKDQYFIDAGRTFIARTVWFGPAATQEMMTTAWQVLNSLRIAPQ